jgi:hypothetical protein
MLDPLIDTHGPTAIAEITAKFSHQCPCFYRGPYGKWTKDDMHRALAAFRNGDMGMNAASKIYGVPKATLKRHHDGTNAFANYEIKQMGRPPVLPEALENELVAYIVDLDSMFYGVNRGEVMSLTYELAKRNDLQHRFNAEREKAGKDWFRAFMSRHPELSLRQPEATSLARVKGFKKESVMHFMDLLEPLVDKYGLDALRIFNMDESGLTTVQKPARVLSLKGKHQVGAITSGERGVNTTVVCCVNPSGQYVPPMLIFKRKRMKEELKNGAPPGSLVTNNKSGWMDEDLFMDWLRHFHSFVKSTKERPVLLILDGHTTHTKNLKAIDFARDNGIVMLSFPPHCTHRMQPLDVAFFKPLKVYYNQACDRWLRNHPGRTITTFQVSELFGEAYAKSATMTTAANGFQKTGIWPCSRDVFTDADFAPSILHIGDPTEENGSEQEPGLGDTRSTQAEAEPAEDGNNSRSTDVETGMNETSSTQVEQAEDGNNSRSTDAETGMNETSSTQVENEIRTNPDGRCFFRSLAIAMNKDLERGSRDTDGLCVDKMLDVYEQTQADQIRLKMVAYMCENIQDYSGFDSTRLNADLPPDKHFASIQERIAAVACPKEMVGELEIVATSNAIQRQISVKCANETLSYGEQYPGVPLVVRFTSMEDAEDCGHYDCVVQHVQKTRHESVRGVSPVRHYIGPEVISPKPTHTPGQKKGRASTRSEVLTSSPYKRALSERKKQSKSQKKKTPQKKKLSKSGHKTKQDKTKKSKKANWYCILCGENREEKMVRCTECKKWVHSACGCDDGSPDYRCDFCVNP